MMLLFWGTLAAILIIITHDGKTFVEGRAMDKENVDPLQTLSGYNGYAYDFRQGPVGVYSFYYNLPHSSRYEERTASGEVKGNYAYIAPEGSEFKFKYEAGKKGFQVESNALPTAPEDTEEVKKAKQEFFEAYERALAQAELEGYGRKNGASRALQRGESKVVKGFDKDEDENEGKKNKHGEGEKEKGEEEEEEEEEEKEKKDEEEEEDEDDDEEESSAESSEEKDDYYKNYYEESSEESDNDEDDEDDEESSEEDDDNEESSEESSAEDDEENEEEIRKTLNKRINSGFSRRKSSSYVIPNYIYKNRVDLPTYRRPITRTYNSRGRRRYKRTRNS